jgi:hypothetical protein
MTSTTAPHSASPYLTELELDDIQAGTLRPRPNPYAGAYRTSSDRRDGQEPVRRLAEGEFSRPGPIPAQPRSAPHSASRAFRPSACPRTA